MQARFSVAFRTRSRDRKAHVKPVDNKIDLISEEGLTVALLAATLNVFVYPLVLIFMFDLKTVHVCSIPQLSTIPFSRPIET